jgi:hypothetical protein
MKVIRDIVLQIDYEEGVGWDGIYTRDFEFRCRFIGNYLKRRLTKSGFEPMDFNRLAINGCVDKLYSNRISESYLCVAVPFDKNRYDSLTKEEMPDFFLDMYKKGILRAQETHQLPVDFFLKELGEFKINGFKNEWEFKSKICKEIGIKATLFCRMTLDAFTLSLVLYKNKEVIYNREILNTFPDETCYHYLFKDLIFEDDKIIVTGWYNAPPLFELDLSFKLNKLTNE